MTETLDGGGEESTAGYRMYLFVIDDTLVQVKGSSADLLASPANAELVPKVATITADKLTK